MKASRHTLLRFFQQVRSALLAIHPQFLMWHHVKFESPLEPTDEFQGGYSAGLHFAAIVGWVRFYVQKDGKLTLIFGSFPKNAEGKNEWKELHRLSNVEEANLKTVLENLDNKDVSIPGAITAAQAKRRNLKRLKK